MQLLKVSNFFNKNNIKKEFIINKNKDKGYPIEKFANQQFSFLMNGRL